MTTTTIQSAAISTNTTAFGSIDASTSSHVDVDLLPPSDSLATLMNSGDVGSTIAALAMLTSKESRTISRQSRNAAYAAEDAAERDSLHAMSEAASTKLITGLTTGGLKLGSAGISVKSPAGSKAIDAFASIDGAIGEFCSDGHDRNAKAAEHRSSTMKRIAEQHGDDVRDADKSIERTLGFLKDWLAAKDGAQAAAIHRA